MKKFEFFDVTADIGFYAYGNNLNEAFENAGLASEKDTRKRWDVPFPDVPSANLGFPENPPEILPPIPSLHRSESVPESSPDGAK